jgi:uncharacterized membrane protein YciS (DUF1049 family)
MKIVIALLIAIVFMLAMLAWTVAMYFKIKSDVEAMRIMRMMHKLSVDAPTKSQVERWQRVSAWDRHCFPSDED